jgi:putative Mn2+ efflux pump MntP
MNLLITLFVAVSLALDAFAVAVTSGILVKETRLIHALKIGVFFGSFQGIMPMLGWLGGSFFKSFIAGVDHWIAFSLLCFIGIHMIYESVRVVHKERDRYPLGLGVLLLLSIATSIDALAVGIGFAFLEVAILRTGLVIGLVTFFLTFIGYYVGSRLGHFFANRVRIFGGIILIGIGVKILVEHLQ